MKKPNGYWTYDRCKKEALKYKTRSSFKTESYSAYSAAQRLGILTDICKHCYRPNGNLIYTKEICQKEALKYKYRTDFCYGNPSAYSSAHKKGFLDDICKHMNIKGNLKYRGIYAIEFPDNCVYVGLTHDFDQRYRHHLLEGPVKRHMDKTGLIPILKPLTKYLPVEKAKIKEGFYNKKYTKKGWVQLSIAIPGSIGSGLVLYHKKDVLKKALKYRSISDFSENARGYYAAAHRNGYLKEATSHMKKRPSPKRIPIIGLLGRKKIKFPSITIAAMKIKVSASHINSILHGKGKTAKGYKFKYA